MSEEVDPQKYHVMTPKIKRTLLLLSIFIFFVLIPSLSFIYYKVAVHRPSQTAKEANFEIGSGDNVFEVAGMLYDKEAINSEFLFILYVFLNRSDTNIQAGTYKIPAGTSLVDLVENLSHGRNDVVLTFLEGWRVEQFAVLASQKLGEVKYEDFVELASSKEGYLFPDTYFFNKDADAEDVINKLFDNFNKKTSDILTDENLERAGLTREQAVIFASMVEREISNIDDRSVVAGILIKRWKEESKLDVDATTQYASALSRLCEGESICAPTLDQIYNLQWWPKDLTKEELDRGDPYNTRAVVGLPPAPISSVSLSSLSAVLNYQDSPYYYYLTDRDGVTHYAKTLEEHNQNISNYLN
jgi:UPF0755 protein